MGQMPMRTVFISSTTCDLWQYRKVASEVVGEIHQQFGGRLALRQVSMDVEKPTGERTTPLDVSRGWVATADWIVLVVGWRYGHVPDGETCSVTEWEFKQATEVSNPPKDCFIFLAADREDKPHPYRALDVSEEEENLADFRGGNGDHEAAMARFRARLRQWPPVLFRDIQDFRSKLSSTLTNKMLAELIKSLGPDILGMGLLPSIEKCINEVKILARLKRVHDRLHKVRQFGIRPLRETVLPLWPESGGLATAEAKAGLSAAKQLILRKSVEIGVLASELPDDQRQALSTLADVTETELPVDADTEKVLVIEEVNGFARNVEKAFTGCNNEMDKASLRLELAYQRLTSTAEDALSKAYVEARRGEVLRLQLATSGQIYVRLQHVLNHHHKWQTVHDRFEQIDSSIEYAWGISSATNPGLEREALLRKLRSIISNDGKSVRDLLGDAEATWQSEEPLRLQAWPALITKVQRHLSNVLETPGLEAYQGLRTAFDDLFYEVDRETLYTVEASEGRVRAMEAGLLGIKAAITSPASV